MYEDLVCRTVLHYPARLEHDDIARDSPHEREVVGDEDHRKAALGLQASQQADYHRLDRYVERRGDFIANKQVWLDDQSTGYCSALTLSPG